MHASFDIWMALAGVAIFLLGMSFMEEALHQLSGRPFKLFLKKHTSSKIKAIAGGTLITGILQSSSVLNFMILALTGAGVIKMQNALAVLLGANLGSTLNSWIIATVGFKLSIESVALAITGVAGICMVLSGRESKWHSPAKLLLGFGLLFMGLGYIKNGMEELVKQFNLQALARYPSIILFLAGVLMTSIVQSSSATVAIVLSALHVNAINLYIGTAIVLGSEIGTSLKLVLASAKGIAVKKRLAYGNLLYNIISALIILLLLRPVNEFVTGIVGIRDNLTALVFFQTLVNVAGIIIFFPFLDLFGKFLEKRIGNNEPGTLFISKVNVADTELAMEAMEKETRQFLFSVSQLLLAAFDRPLPGAIRSLVNNDLPARSVMAKYEYIKQVHGKLNEYCIQLGSNLMDPQATARLEQLVAATRNAMYAAKSLKDAYADIGHLRNSSNNIKYGYYCNSGDMVAGFYERLLTVVIAGRKSAAFDSLAAIYRWVQEKYAESLQKLYNETGVKQVSEIEFSTLMNFNREMYTSLKSAVFAAKDYLLTRDKAAYFDELPGFIR